MLILCVMSLQHGCFLSHLFNVLTGIFRQMTQFDDYDSNHDLLKIHTRSYLEIHVIV